MLRSRAKMMNASSSLVLPVIIGLIFSILTVKAADTHNSTDAQQSIGPIITPFQREIILQMGQNYTLSCKGKSELQLKQQDIPEEIVAPFFMEQRNASSSDPEYPFEAFLDLYNIDQFAVGYYACYDNTVNISDILNNLTDEPNNTQHVSFIYIYVNGSDSLFAPMREVIISRRGMVLIECRPTTPDVKVSLLSDMAEFKITKYSPKIGYIIDGEDLVDDSFTAFNCDFVTTVRRTNKEIYVRKHVTPPPNPSVLGGSKYFLKGETFSLNCTVEYQTGLVVNLEWKYPENAKEGNIVSESNAYDKVTSILYLNITIVNATSDYNGKYTCIASNSGGTKPASFMKEYRDKPFINLHNDKNYIETSQSLLVLQLEVDAYPPVEFTVVKDGNVINIRYPKYKLTRRPDTKDALFKINNTNVYDTANYTFIARNAYLSKNFTFDVRVAAEPTINFGPGKNLLVNTNVTFMCQVTGYTLPSVTWIFSNGEELEMKPTKLVSRSLYEATAYLDTSVHKSGNITCKASNPKKTKSETRSLLVYEIPDGFGITEPRKELFWQDENVVLKCIASIYNFTNVNWLGNDGEVLKNMAVYNRNNYSYIAILKINQITLNHAGNYTCVGTALDGRELKQTIPITVAALQSPQIIYPAIDINEEYFVGVYPQLNCQADGVPPPKLEWYKGFEFTSIDAASVHTRNDDSSVVVCTNTASKDASSESTYNEFELSVKEDIDGKLLVNESNVNIYTTNINQTYINSTVIINGFKKDNQGKYECIAVTDTDQQSKYYMLTTKENADNTMYLSAISVIIFALIILVVYLTWKIKKEKKFRKELAEAGLLYFKEGAAGSLNPERGIDEQAELLPYDDKFEFPAEKLILGKQLGAGAFGVVYKAEARGMSDAEETTVVAVKMVKKTADNMYIKALASELKIMVHLGKHVNIVNLLGACTKNVGKRELIVIVEYCKFGNIHNYMQKHREVFIDQLTDNKEKNLGRVNRGFSSSTGSTGVQSDYFTSANTQDTDHTFVNTANSHRSGRKDNSNQVVEPTQVSEGYIQPEWRSNYESDYVYDSRNPRPLTSRDLLAWAFQIARGMEYLANRKVLHGDLAARNVLLAEDNVVKICDFGLARSIYKNDEYQKKENSPLPVKWLAIECMADRIFSTQSDVWSFGIVLWELFSLAKTPYPNISPPSLLQWLSKGYRLEKPPYADDRLYEVMTKCWQQKPNARPSFSELQELLGTFLEDNVRNHYVDLNSMYMDINNQQHGAQDYLDMVCAPDYNNVVTPSPHHYINMNKSFFPSTPLPLDEDGYLQVSPAGNQAIFSPRPQNATFDFDARKFNTRASEASSGGSELTPMLTLNNLPARSGSESDHEGATFPYSNVVCPRIDEETDEVFETKQNNAKNAQNNIAVSNPTYSFDVAIEKKPKDIINNYVNMNIPNGLVK